MKTIYKTAIRPVLFQLDAEQAHDIAHRLICSTKPLWRVLGTGLQNSGDDLRVNFCNVSLSNPIGLAAGFDKNGRLVDVLGSFGFGFAEVGSITARASQGNPKPRLFRLPQDRALINRMGLNGDGADAVSERLKQSSLSLPVGINIAKTNDPGIAGDAAIEDILYTFKRVKDLPISFLTINASCPNTAEGRLEEKHNLATIFSEIQKVNFRQLPVLVKLSPDSSDELIEDIVEDAVNCGLAGYVCGNTSTGRCNLSTPESAVQSIGAGGLSGPPLKPLALRLCDRIYKLKKPGQAIIAVGGISTDSDVYEFIRHGANAVELYTAFVYEGPTLIKELNQGLSRLLKRDGLLLTEAVGIVHR